MGRRQIFLQSSSVQTLAMVSMHDGEGKPDEIKRAAAYCRVSTGSDIQEGSFECQKAYYEQKIKSDPKLELVDIYGDLGKSGTSVAKRTEFRRMIRDCKAGKIDVIFTKSISRFSRNLADCVETVRKLKELGITVIFEKENINTMDSNGELLLSVLATIAQEESNSISQNVKWAMEQAHMKGRVTGSISYEYRFVREDKSWTIEESEAKKVRAAFKAAAECKSYRQIIEMLDAMERAEGNNDTWSQKRVRFLLRNENYTGNILTNKNYKCSVAGKLIPNRGERDQYYIEGHHEAIVSRELFDRVQRIIASGLLHSGRRGEDGSCNRETV